MYTQRICFDTKSGVYEQQPTKHIFPIGRSTVDARVLITFSRLGVSETPGVSHVKLTCEESPTGQCARFAVRQGLRTCWLGSVAAAAVRLCDGGWRGLVEEGRGWRPLGMHLPCKLNPKAHKFLFMSKPRAHEHDGPSTQGNSTINVQRPFKPVLANCTCLYCCCSFEYYVPTGLSIVQVHGLCRGEGQSVF